MLRLPSIVRRSAAGTRRVVTSEIIMSEDQDIPEAREAASQIVHQLPVNFFKAVESISVACREYAKRKNDGAVITVNLMAEQLSSLQKEKEAALANADANIAALHHELATLREDVKPLLDSMMMNDAKSAFLSKHPDLQ